LYQSGTFCVTLIPANTLLDAFAENLRQTILLAIGKTMTGFVAVTAQDYDLLRTI